MNQYHWDLVDPVADNLYISHHGMKGMRWGERQWQNKDGSLTPAGRIHYGVGKAKEAAGQAIGKVKTAVGEKVKELKYGKTYNDDVIGNVKTKFGKTQYTNLDGTLNEKGKQLASNFTTKEIEHNNKYYDKMINKYKKAAEAYKDEPLVAKKFEQMAKSAEESRDRTNANLQNLSLDQMLTIQMQRNQKAAKIAAGAAGVVGAGALVGAAVNEDINKQMNDMFNSIGPDTLMSTVNDLSQTEVGRKGMQMVDSSIRMYADARAYVVGTAIDQSMNRLNAMGIPQKAGQMVGNAATEAANSMANSGAPEAYAKIGSKFMNTFLDESSGSMSNFNTQATTMLNNAERATKLAQDIRTEGSAASSAISKVLNADINSVGSTAASNVGLVDRAVNTAIRSTQGQASQSTQDYVESLKAAGHTLAEIERETGLSRQLINSIL